MLYTAAEIVAFLAVAALLGVAVGWTVKGLSLRRQLEAGFEQDLSSRQLRINTLEDDLHEAHDQIQATQSALRDAELQIEQERAATLTAQARLDEAEAAASEMRARLALLGQELANLRAATTGSQAERAPLEARIDELTIKLEAKDQQLADLRSGAHAPSHTGAPASPPTSAPGAASPATAQDTRPPPSDSDDQARDPARDVAGTVSEPPSPGDVATETAEAVARFSQSVGGLEPQADDDLKRIHGIGPKIERTLKSLGITSYRQIAHLTDADVDALGDHLGHFRDRIRRDNWIASATELHRQTHGTDP